MASVDGVDFLGEVAAFLAAVFFAGVLAAFLATVFLAAAFFVVFLAGMVVWGGLWLWRRLSRKDAAIWNMSNFPALPARNAGL